MPINFSKEAMEQRKEQLNSGKKWSFANTDIPKWLHEEGIQFENFEGGDNALLIHFDLPLGTFKCLMMLNEKGVIIFYTDNIGLFKSHSKKKFIEMQQKLIERDMESGTGFYTVTKDKNEEHSYDINYVVKDYVDSFARGDRFKKEDFITLVRRAESDTVLAQSYLLKQKLINFGGREGTGGESLLSHLIMTSLLERLLHSLDTSDGEH